MAKIIITKSAGETKKIAANFACGLVKSKPGKKAAIISLIGDLGSGKTVFSQGFARGLGIKENIVSPTFVLERIYKLPQKDHRHLVHIDAYRFEKPKELLDLSFNSLVKNPQNIILIEWADRVRKILPRNCIKIRFEHFDKNKRKITIWKNKKKL